MANSTDQKLSKKTINNGDILLKTIVSVINYSGLEASLKITLNIKGQIISGSLIGNTDYFEGLINSCPGNSNKSNLDEKLVSIFSTLKQKSTERDKQQQEDYDNYADAYIDAIEYIHLKEVKTLCDGKFIPLNNGFWRGRISEVSGFILGESIK